MSFQIPKSEREHITAFVAANPALLDALGPALAGCLPSLSQRGFIDSVTKKIGDVSGAEPATITSAVRTLFGIYGVLMAGSKTSPSDAAADVVLSIQKDKSFGVPADGWPSFQKRLAELLSYKTLSLSLLLGRAAFETPRHAHGLRVLTDARPVFGAKGNDGPMAFAILHTLHFDYYEDSESRDWYISLDSDDLTAIRDAANSALARQKNLHATLEPLGLPVVSWRLSDDK